MQVYEVAAMNMHNYLTTVIRYSCSLEINNDMFQHILTHLHVPLKCN